jgi:hypothetical protein
MFCARIYLPVEFIFNKKRENIDVIENKNFLENEEIKNASQNEEEIQIKRKKIA